MCKEEKRNLRKWRKLFIEKEKDRCKAESLTLKFRQKVLVSRQKVLVSGQKVFVSRG
jgi:hypothetical protein